MWTTNWDIQTNSHNVYVSQVEAKRAVPRSEAPATSSKETAPAAATVPAKRRQQHQLCRCSVATAASHAAVNGEQRCAPDAAAPAADVGWSGGRGPGGTSSTGTVSATATLINHHQPLL